MPRIADQILDDILSRTDIVELISGYIPLKKAGRNFKANCPFHHEKTPSFVVSPDKQIYHCFGCGESGNAFKFLMQHERIDFIEAVEALARKAGVVLPEPKDNDKTYSISGLIYKANELAAQFYHDHLDSQALAQEARNYLSKRMVKRETAKLFKLGFSSDKWDGLLNYLRQKDISISTIEKAGLIIKRSNGGYYDRFRSRIIFPVFDTRSRIIAFGGRAFENTEKESAKYINSPETPVYTKGNHLYGLNFTKDAICETNYAIVVEGYLDLIIPYQEGIRNIVASLGTAFTANQASLLKRYTQNVVMVYDADKAGQMATLRNLDIFIEEGMNVRVASLEQGSDPDSFVRKYGPGKFLEAINSAKNLFDYKLNALELQYGEDTPEAKTKVINEIFPTLKKFKNSILCAEYLKKLAEHFNINEQHLYEEFKKSKAVLDDRQAAVSHTAKTMTEVHPTEKMLLKLMLQETALIENICNHIGPDDFMDKRVSRIVEILFEAFKQGKEIHPNRLFKNLEDKQMLEFVCSCALADEAGPDNRNEIVDGCIQMLKSKRKMQLMRHLQEEMQQAEKNNDDNKLNILKLEYCRLTKKGR
ncbi:MAG: DNA primase [Candidatus Omnitrophica bacterium]|jgi:DNA primase|nr:DNA primase [Candidatus Omnitrophota bacterium]